MPSGSYGIVVEGSYDTPVYEELIWKISSSDVEIIPRETGGVDRLKRIFPTLLRDLEQVRSGLSVDKALVISDSGGKDPVSIEQELQGRIRGQHFSFPKGVAFHAVRQTVETWLLADEAAINSVAVTRGGRRISLVRGALENITNPKEKLRQLLSGAGLPYVPQVCREIARQANVDTLRYRCPSFRIFGQKVTDC